MEAETTAENVSSDTSTAPVNDGVTSAEDFGTLLSRCGSCKEGLQNRNPKLLSCLHTFCLHCVNSLETGDNGQVTCPVCRQVSLASNMIDNMFLSDIAAPAAASATASDTDTGPPPGRTCTGCEENITASHYCTECTEFLCEPCAQAHRRVKVTKDHTVEPVDRMPAQNAAAGASSAPKRRPLLCPIHPHEPLKLYCDTCARLTCRDCQLVEHKDHKYQFVQEAAVSCRELLQSLLSKIKEKQSHIENAKSLIDRRHKEITTKEQSVAQEIKACAMSLVREINSKGHQLIGELQAVCGAKRRQLDQKNTEVRLLSDNLEHGLRFADYLLTHTDDAALLYSRRTLAHQLSAILRTRCEVPNPYHVVDLRFSPNPTVSAAIANLGCLMVDGYQYGQRNAPSAAAGAANPVAAATGTNGRVSSSSAHGFTVGATRSAAASGSSSTLTSEQKLQKLQMLIQMRRMEQQQQQRTQQRVAALIGSGAPPPSQIDYSLVTPDYTSGSRTVTRASAVPPPLSRHVAQMPNQSANISSSNHRSSSAGLPGYPPLVKQTASPTSSYLPSSLAPTGRSGNSYPPGASITLSQLHNERMKRSQPPELVSTSMPPNPIVIQPTDLSEPMPRSMLVSSPGSTTNNFGGGSFQLSMDSQHFSGSSNISFDSSAAGVSSACDILSMTPAHVKNESRSLLSDIIKQEFKPMDSGDMKSAALSRSRTPTPRIESTSHDPPSGNSPQTTTGTVDLSGIDQLAAMATDNNFGLCETSGDIADSLINANDDMFGLNGSGEAGLSGWPEVIGQVHAAESSSHGEQLDEAGTSRTPPAANEPASVADRSQSIDGHNEDRNEDYCAVCRNGGDLLCCDRCPRVYHLPCHLPLITAFPEDNVQWLCSLCAHTDDSLRLDAPEPRPTIGSKRRSGPGGLTDRELQICERLLLELYTHELSLPFQVPVPKSIPNYYKMIARPMDLGKIRMKLNKTNVNHYQSVEDFVSDIQLVFSNCATFNPPDTEIGKAGLTLHTFFISRLVDLLPYVDHSSTPVSDPTDWPAMRGGAAVPAAKRRRANPRSTKGSSHGSIDGEAVSSPDIQLEKDDSRHSAGGGTVENNQV